MKNKKIKMIISIILMTSIMLLSTTSMGIRINGKWYYSGDECYFNYNKSQIELIEENGSVSNYWCINHKKRTMSKGMAKSKSLTLDIIETYVTQSAQGVIDSQSDADLFLEWHREALHSKLELQAKRAMGEKRRTASIVSSETKNARNVLEATIYAFAKEKSFNVTNSAIADAIWNFEKIYGDSAAGGTNNLWLAAKDYVQWAGYDLNAILNGDVKDYKGTYENKTPPTVVINNEETKINFNYKEASYKIGPIKLEYDAGSVYGDIRFTKNLSVELTKINKDGTTSNTSDIDIVDADGNILQNIPNGDEFYLIIPYNGNENLKSINGKVSLDYIASVSAKQTTKKTKVQNWKYTIDRITDVVKTEYRHSAACTLHPAASEESRVFETFNGVWKYCYCCNWSAGKDGRDKFILESTARVILELDSEQSDVLQDMRTIDEAKLTWKNITETFTIDHFDQAKMKIAGNVWEDTRTGKDSIFNGSLDTSDMMLEGIEVRLYEADGTLATVGNTNPTLTDKNGYYEFIEINPTKKYFVQFTYDGMIYTNTYGENVITGNIFKDINQVSSGSNEGITVVLYKDGGTSKVAETTTDKDGTYNFINVDKEEEYYVKFTYAGKEYTVDVTYEYNSYRWNALSKGSELVTDRATLNTNFVTVGSYPMGYKPKKAIFTDITYLVDGYNEVYSITNADVLAYKAKITEQLKNYLKTNNRLLDENYIKEIYQPILGRITDNTEAVKARKILQYIWDCRIHSYAGYESVRDGKTMRADELYPYYDKIVLIDNEGNMVTANNEKNINGYWVIYNGQLNVNQGIIRREQTDLNILEDLYKNVVSINGKDVEYKYGALSSKSLEVTSADIQSYTQNIAKSDYNYKIASSTLTSDLTQTSEYPEGYAPIQLYITYSINVKNNKSTPTSVNEIVTYINTKYYSYSDEYTTTQGKTLYGVEGSFIRDNEEKSLADYGVEIKTSPSSICGEKSQTGTNIGTDLYISFNNNIILNNNDALRLYVTYRLGEDSTKDAKYSCTYNDSNRGNSAQVILQDTLAEENAELRLGTQTEINSFSTYYAKGSDVASTQAKYANYYTYTSVADPYTKYRAAGVLDYNSTPGNLTTEEMQKKTEDDWDNAAVLVIKKPGDGNDTRTLLGNVWEVTSQIGGVEQYTESYWANTEEYPIYDDSHSVRENDVTVELIELKNGIEYVRARTTTDNHGNYVLDGFIPGDYTVRFIYGDRAQYDTEQFSEYSKFIINQQELKRPYNGMFYQSTKANPNTNENKYWYAGEEADNTRYSDAYDETNVRLRLAASQQEYTYGDVVDVLRQPSKYMGYAYTSMLDISIEKALEVTRAQNPAYEISNVDFGLTPRSLSKLDIKKEVTHLKLVLANGVVHFDADTSTIREQGVPGVVQAAQGYDINVSMSSELVNGATLEITYAITLTNNTPVDKIVHYKDASNNVIAIGLYNEDAEKLVTFEDGIRIYKDNLANFERLSDGDNSTFDPWVSKIEAGTTELVQLDESKKEIIQSETRALAVADFIPNNLNFIKTNYSGQVINDGWDLYTGTKDELKAQYYAESTSPNPPSLGELVDNEGNRRDKEVYGSNVIVLANADNPLITTNLKPGESVSSEMVLSKVISVNSDSTDTKSYQNNARVLKIYSSDSRLQDMPGTESEKVIISDPTGIGNIYIVIALALVVFAIIGLGVVLIKKFVMARK